MSGRVLTGAGLVGIALAIVFFVGRTEDPTQGAVSDPAPALHDSRVSRPQEEKPDPALLQSRPAEERVAELPEGCVRRVYRNHPAMVQDTIRIEPFSIRHESFGAYRALVESDLLGLVDQGDSAAMAVMGARRLLEANGGDPNTAVDMLLSGQLPPKPEEAQGPDRDQLMEARRWYRESALHGRIAALGEIAFIDGFYRGLTAVDAGLITDDEWNSLSKDEREPWSLVLIYHRAAMLLMDDALDGPIGEMVYHRNGLMSVAVADVAVGKVIAEFEEARDVRGFERPVVEPWTGPSLEEILDESALCPDENGEMRETQAPS